MEEKLTYRFKKFQPAVIGVFKDHDHLEKTLSDLREKNFSDEVVKVLNAKSSEVIDFPIDKDLLVGAHTGALIGLVQGAILCVLASYELITIPGAQTFIEAGAFLSAVAGAAIGINAGAIAGLIVGYIIARVERRKIEHYLEKRGVIISVHTEDPKAQLIAKNVLVTNGAMRIFNPVYPEGDRTLEYNKEKMSNPLPM